MSTVFSTLEHNKDPLVNVQLDHRKNHQIYSTHFNDSLNAQSVTTVIYKTQKGSESC